MDTAIEEKFDKEIFVKAVRQVVSAVTHMPGADCVLYAAVGAGLLSRLGFPAQPVAGSAAWRVGEGDSDVISHATEITGSVFEPNGSEGKLRGMFHAWISLKTSEGNEIVDLTTWQLTKKGKELDLADGGLTNVEFCPDFLWISDKSERLLSPRNVLQSYDSGVFAYIRKPNVEAVVFSDDVLDEARRLTEIAGMCYRSSTRGESIQVVALDENGPSEVSDDSPMRIRQIKPR
jgi:hypothetical protein